MDNQHRKISGYRELSQAEIDLMNKIKAVGEQLGEVVDDVFKHLTEQRNKALNAANGQEEWQRITQADGTRWAAIGRTDLQQGLMALTRAVAQPTTF